jgi:alginate export protein
MRRCIVLVLFLVSCLVRQRINAQTVPDLNADSGSSTNSSSAGTPRPTGSDDSLDWLFPVNKLNRSLPRWFRIGGKYRGRIEGPAGIGFGSTKDFYDLDRLRVHLAIQPKQWLLFYGEVQDARIFFNHHIANANPYEDKWTLWQAYSQVGSSEAGWLDVLAGRQVLRFGDERVIGPSEWLNVGRTFNVARVDLHHPGYEISVFASSVVPGENTDLHNALPGNNLYGVYGSFQNIVPQGGLRALRTLARCTFEL